MDYSWGTSYKKNKMTSPIIEEKHRLRGVFGAAFCALLGGIVWTVLGCAEFDIFIFSMFVFLFTRWGYEKFCGIGKDEDADVFGAVISTIFSLLIIFPAEYIIFGYGIYRQILKQGRRFPLSEVLRDLIPCMDGSELWGRFAFELICSYLVAIVVAVTMIIQAHRKQVEVK